MFGFACNCLIETGFQTEVDTSPKPPGTSGHQACMGAEEFQLRSCSAVGFWHSVGLQGEAAFGFARVWR